MPKTIYSTEVETIKPTNEIEMTIRASIAAHAILDLCKSKDHQVIRLKMVNAANEFLELDKFIRKITS